MRTYITANSCEDTDITKNVSKACNVKVINPNKVGEGLSAHVTYQIIFTGFGPSFSERENCVTRRFSDFLGLHDRICSRHQLSGVIVPPAPDKNIFGTTKVMISKDTSLETEFIERRRVALERFLSRLLSHPVLRDSSDLLEFLEYEGELPRYPGSPLLSGVGAKKMLKSFGNSLGKFAHKIDDPEEHSVLKREELVNWERQLKRLYGSLSSSVSSDQDLALAKLSMSQTISQLANIEEHTGLAQALDGLSDAEAEVSQCCSALAEAKLTHLVDCSRDSLRFIQASRNAIDDRFTAFRLWKTGEATLRAKREQKDRLGISGKCDQKKLSEMDLELDDVLHRVDANKANFENMSQALKMELERINAIRFNDFFDATTQFLLSMLQSQEKLVKTWESYLLRAKSIN